MRPDREDEELRMAQVTTQFADIGGVENVVQSLAEELSGQHQVDLVTRERPQNTDSFPEAFSEVHVLEDTDSYIGFFTRARSFLQENSNHYDVFHFHNWSTVLPATGLDIDSVLTTHGTTFDVQASEGNWLRASVYWLLEEAAFNIPDQLTSVTESHLEPFRIRTPTDVIRNGVDTDTFSPGDTATSESFEVLIVGKHNQAKNHSALIQAASDMDDVKLLVPSDGPLTGQLREQADSFGVDAEFSGRVSQEELVDLYQRADLFCLPSENEGLPLSMLEALSCGTPVLVSDIGDNAQIAEESGAGRAVESGIPQKIKSGIESIRKGNLQDMSENARRYAERELDWGRVTERYEEVYRSVYR